MLWFQGSLISLSTQGRLQASISAMALPLTAWSRPVAALGPLESTAATRHAEVRVNTAGNIHAVPQKFTKIYRFLGDVCLFKWGLCALIKKLQKLSLLLKKCVYG